MTEITDQIKQKMVIKRITIIILIKGQKPHNGWPCFLPLPLLPVLDAVEVVADVAAAAADAVVVDPPGRPRPFGLPRPRPLPFPFPEFDPEDPTLLLLALWLLALLLLLLSLSAPSRLLLNLSGRLRFRLLHGAGNSALLGGFVGQGAISSITLVSETWTKMCMPKISHILAGGWHQQPACCCHFQESLMWP